MGKIQLERTNSQLIIIVTDKEFELLDELYFVTSFKALGAALDWSRDEILNQLGLMVGKGWVKCLDPDTEQEVACADTIELYKIVEQVLFLATKKGLMEHNTK